MDIAWKYGSMKLPFMPLTLQNSVHYSLFQLRREESYPWQCLQQNPQLLPRLQARQKQKDKTKNFGLVSNLMVGVGSIIAGIVKEYLEMITKGVR
jgi:hypothetical protein